VETPEHSSMGETAARVRRGWGEDEEARKPQAAVFYRSQTGRAP
jgi:hypothetical protein